MITRLPLGGIRWGYVGVCALVTFRLPVGIPYIWYGIYAIICAL